MPTGSRLDMDLIWVRDSTLHTRSWSRPLGRLYPLPGTEFRWFDRGDEGAERRENMLLLRTMEFILMFAPFGQSTDPSHFWLAECIMYIGSESLRAATA